MRWGFFVASSVFGLAELQQQNLFSNQAECTDLETVPGQRQDEALKHPLPARKQASWERGRKTTDASACTPNNFRQKV